MAKTAKTETAPVPDPSPVRNLELEIDLLRQRFEEAKAAISKARAYIAALKLGLEGARYSGQDSYQYNIHALLQIVFDLEQWALREEVALSQPDEAQETMH